MLLLWTICKVDHFKEFYIENMQMPGNFLGHLFVRKILKKDKKRKCIYASIQVLVVQNFNIINFLVTVNHFDFVKDQLKN